MSLQELLLLKFLTIVKSNRNSHDKAHICIYVNCDYKIEMNVNI